MLAPRTDKAPMSSTKFIVSVLATVALLTPPQALAQANDVAVDGPICENTSGHVAPTDRLAACGRILHAGGLTPAQESMTRVNRAWSFSLLHKMADARADYDKAVELDPGSHVAYNERGLFHLRNGQLDAAIEDYDVALRLRPDAAFSFFGRGVAYLRKGDTARGGDDLAKARRLDGNVDVAFRNIGITP